MSTYELCIDVIKEWVLSLGYATKAWVQSLSYATEVYVQSAIVTVLNWVSNQNYLQTGFVDRGDPANVDWNKDDFTRDGAWHELDLSSIVPAGAKAVLFVTNFIAEEAEGHLLLRRDGTVNNRNWSAPRCAVADMWHAFDLVCPCSADRKVEYLVNDKMWLYLTLTVKGWWI